MFGAFRYILAVFVMLHHLWPKFNSWAGAYAVFTFYVLSGYLMSYVLHEVYGLGWSGISRFCINRALRIYPPYWATMAFSIGVVSLIPEIARDLNPTLILPRTGLDWFENMLVLGMTNESLSRLVPPAWSLSVELSFYLGMALMLARGRFLSVVWFLASLFLTAFLILGGYGWQFRYFSLLGASLPFSIGSILYFYFHRDDRRLRITPAHSFLAPVFFCIHVLAAQTIWSDVRGAGFYVSLILGTWAVAALSSLDVERMPIWLRRIDRAAGDLAYPLFLCHWPVAALVIWVAFNGYRPDSGALFLTTLLATNLIALIINRGIAMPIDTVRRRIRSYSQMIRHQAISGPRFGSG